MEHDEKMEKEYIERNQLIHELKDWLCIYPACVRRAITNAPAANVVEIEVVAEMLRDMFDDNCACNYCGNDEWLPEKCRFAETECPEPTEKLGCWREFIIHTLAKRKERG